jgi:PAS domain S-box-containing protein
VRPVESLALVAAIADDLPCGVWVAAVPDGTFVYSNHAFDEIMGMGPVADVGVGGYAAPYGIFDRDGTHYPEQRMPFVRAVEARATVIVDDLVIHRRDGRRVYVRAFGKPMFDESSTMTHVAIAFFDISGEVAAEAARARAEDRLREVIAHAPVVLFAVDLSGTLTLVDGRIRRQLGVVAADLVGKSALDLYPEAPAVAAGLRRALAGETNSYVAELAGATYETHIAPMRNPAGEIIGAIGVATDVTERHRMQAQLARAERLASLGMLAAGVSHEVNNPLSFVLGSLELMASDIERARGPARDAAVASLEERLRDARAGAERVRTIVRELKTFARVDERPVRPVDVRAALDAAAAMARNEIRHRARLVLDVEPSLRVSADEGRLGQIFLNLLLNAAHAIAEGDANANEIRVVARPDGDSVRIEVTDTGSGIAADALPKIFDPFFTTKGAGGGTGLGLAICHAIVTALGGRIEIESVVGRGTTARVSLPAARGDLPSHGGEDRNDGARATARRGAILVVDDEPLILKVLAAMLEAEHDVTTETSAEAALARVRAGERFDAIVCDLMMPQITGMDVYDALLEIAPDQAHAMLFLTGGAFTPRAHAFLERIADAVLDKPVDSRELVKRVRRIVDAPRTT